ncbi:MAG: peptide chain release factor 1 [bacterium]
MLLNKLGSIEKRFTELEDLLASPKVISDKEKYQALSKEHSDIKTIVSKFREYKKIKSEMDNLKAMTRDKEVREMAEAELKEHEKKEHTLSTELEYLLLPRDPNDERDIFMEIRAGTGGEEAALFAGQLLRMFLRYAERKGFKAEIINDTPTGLGGYKEAVIAVHGKGAYGLLKYESGTHRVQRVPATEASGRVHTSAATVAVMPEAEEVDLKIDERDLRVDTFRSGGAGGQNVNKVSSAIRITHVPTNTVVVCQDERSQHQNRAKAMNLLRSRLLDEKKIKQKGEMDELRRVQIGSGDRSEKIRTYNFPQNRVTDHRIGISLYKIDAIMDGDMDEMVEALAIADKTAKLEKSKHAK